MRVHPAIIWALGLTQIAGYGTLYYSFSVVAPAIGHEYGWSQEWVFGALSAALLAGGLLAPLAGHLFDRFGAARMMAFGSAAAAITLALAALAPNGPLFAAALIAMEITSTLVLYAAAFAALVELGGASAQRSITHLTLIAGFASTIFWPLTMLLSDTLTWREIYFVFAGINLLICLPLHAWIAAQTKAHHAKPAPTTNTAAPIVGSLPTQRRSVGLALLLGGFAIEGFLLSGVLMQIIPLINALGLAASTVLITTLFGPAQVLSRFVNMLFGRGLRATHLAVIASALLPAGILVLATTAPSIPGAILFAVLFGLGSGLTSIVSGSLPLELYGRERYGARQIASALAPFGLALLIGATGTSSALIMCVVLGAVSIGAFAWVALMARPVSPVLETVTP